MNNRPQHLDDILAAWPYEFGEASARMVQGADGRDVLQLRVDLGLLQLETTGRPDGWRPGGLDTYYDYLVSLAFQEGPAFALDDARCVEIDREFVQFFHRRICWLAVRNFQRAVDDADHTLALMDFSSSHAPETAWAEMHEQYRPFVLFHRTQAAALAELEHDKAQAAVAAIDEGIERIRSVFAEHEAEEEFEDDELAVKLREMKLAIVDHFEIKPPLAEQLAQAIAAEQYELAAKLRDKMSRRKRRKT